MAPTAAPNSVSTAGRTRRRAGRGRSLALGLAVLATGIACLLGMAGCDATTVDAYVATSQTTAAADGSTVSTTTRTLDENGNVVETDVTDATAAGVESAATTEGASGQDGQAVTFDVYGVAEPATGSCDYDLDDYGQPTRITYSDEAGTVVSERTLTYGDAQGHLVSETYTTQGFSYTTTYDSQDGWPLTGSVTVNGTTVDVEFVYEISETGSVEVQHVTVDGQDVARYSYAYEEYDGSLEVSRRDNPDGTSTSYTYELVENPSPYAMVRALVHEVDYEALLPYLGL